MYRTFYAKAAEYTSFSSTHGTFSRMYYILSHKTNFNKFKQNEINVKHFLRPQWYEIRSERKLKKITNMWKLGNTLLSNQCQ